MKVLDLLCTQRHTFEGWFASEDDFQSQLACGLVLCPMCGSSEVRKGLSAPRLNLGAAPDSAPCDKAFAAAPSASAPASHPMLAPQMQAAWLQLARHLVAHTEDVGPRFAQEALRMHHGESEERAIRGQATPEETLQLLEEGVPVLPLLLPESAKETLQ